jgi:hypothetical protein
MTTHIPYEKKSVLLLLLTSITLVLFSLWLIDTPSGMPTELIGTVTQSLYINPRLEPPYTRISAVLENGENVTAEGPAGLQINKGQEVILLRYERLISRWPTYKYSDHKEGD